MRLAQSNPLIDVDGTRATINAIDNEDQIDRPDELDTASGTPHEFSADDLARELGNPNTPLAKLTLENTTTFFDGDLPGADGTVGNLFLFQPVFPFPLVDDGTTNLFIRPAFTFFTHQPVFEPSAGGFSSKTNLGDAGFDIALGQSFDNGVVVVGGMQGTVPIGVAPLTGEQLRLGPEFIAAYVTKDWAVAAFPAHQWNVAGGGLDYSTTAFQPIGVLYLDGGWTVGSQPQMFYDWKSNEATIPLNLVVRKVTKIGKLPVQISAEIDYFLASNDQFGPEWAFTLNFTPVVPNFIYDLLN